MKAITMNHPDRAVNEGRRVNEHSIFLRFTARLLVLVMLLQGFSPAAFAQSPVKLQNWQGAIDLASPGAVHPFSLAGTASHLGKFTAHGEVEFVPGEKAGTLVGEGVVVF